MEKREMNIPRQWETKSQLEQTIEKMRKAREAKEISMADSGLLGSEEEGSFGDKAASYWGQAGDYVTGLLSQDEPDYMSSENLKGENRYLNKLASEEYVGESMNGTPFPTYNGIREDTEGESALDKIGRDNMLDDMDDLGPDTMDVESEPSTWDNIKGMFSSDDDGGGKAEGLSPMQKLGAKLVMEHFKDDPAAPQQTIGASPLTPGRTFDMSYLNNRPKKERYRNQGLLGRA